MQQHVELYYYAGRGRERKTCDSRKQRVRVLPILPIINLLVSVERPIRALNALPFAPLCRGSLRFYRARVGERDTKMSLVCHPFPPPLAVTLCEPCVAERMKNTVFFLSLPFFHVGVLILVFLPFPPFFFIPRKMALLTVSVVSNWTVCHASDNKILATAARNPFSSGSGQVEFYGK